jgi:hypothetical protein
MNFSNPIIDKDFLLKKFPGKGGWTYTPIPEIPQDKHAHFGWVRVNVSIDGYVMKKYKLMPMGNGQLFLPVKAEIRKKIGKQAGDYVRVIIELDHTPQSINEELMACFELEPKPIYENFSMLTQDEQQVYLDWIYEAKTEDIKAERIIKMMDRLGKNLKLYDKG